MGYLKAGYYIDELEMTLERIVGSEVLTTFYDKTLPFHVAELPQQIDLGDVNPLLKVAWNIITRGRPTRASLNLSEHILKTHLGDDNVLINFDGPEAKIEYDWPALDEINTDLVKNLLEKLPYFSEEQVAKRFGEQCLTLYRILTDLQVASRVHQLILLLYIIYNPSGRFDVEIKGVDQNLARFIVQDLNELIGNLCSLVSDTEKPINEISYNETKSSHVILLNDTPDNGFSIRSLSPKKIKESEEADYFQRVLTDRRITYAKLGTLHEQEVDEKYVQNFEYASDEQQSALHYILRNLFRKSRFRSGQESIINRALIDKDVIGLLPTGGGKSLTYQICGILQPGVTIVIEPINSLMKDQYDGLISNGINNTVFINSFNTREEREEYLSNLIGSRYQFVYISPERLQIQKFRSHLTECAEYGVYFSFAVIDEAHCVSEWGHDFRHTYLNLAHNLKRFCKAKDKELIFFGLTATASFDVLADVQRELEMAEDAIVTLPADAIDRKELNFNIIKIEKDLSDDVLNNFFHRENEVGEEKYPTLKKSIQRIPDELKRLSGKTQIIDLGDNFFTPNEDGEYENAGVIFCPTKSDKLRNGVLSVKDYLENRGAYLDIGTFFGGGDEDSIRNKRVEQEASDSVENQDAFMNNEKNLMIATKAFGMGLDKPNIRYTYHYSFPDSVESFYQEAGRAGRDGKNSLCNILYYDEDIRTNYDFYQNSFKGISREKEIIDEFLTEVQYEEGFYAEILNRKAKDEFPEINKVSYWNDRYLNIFGTYHENPNNRVQIASIDLKRDFRTYDNFIKNFDEERSQVIADRVIEILKTEADGQDYIEWLNTTSSPGIKTLLDQDEKKKHSLLIGFNNNTVNELSDFLLQSNPGFEPRVIRAAYNFCRSADEFIDNLVFRYRQHSGYTRHLNIDERAIDETKSKYYQIRNTGDTLRAIYRFMLAGIVDDYVIDYSARMVKIEFQAKTDAAYFKNLNRYLKRYLGNESTEKWMKIAKEKEYESVLRKVLFTLIEFIEQEISEKRKRAIDYMQQLCEIGYEQGDQVFRENIIYYFTSKYARVNYLPKDTDGGREESAEIVKKYLSYISNPPDGLGGEINNAKHLRGACENLRITMTRENASIDLLTAYSYFALESQQSENFESAIERPLIKQAIRLYKKGFKDLQAKESWGNILELLEVFNTKVLDINPMIEPVLKPLTNKVLIYRTSNRLSQFLNKIS